MSNKSGTSSQIISLPNGGGALNGIGEKFSPDLHTGTGNFTIPMALPPGRNGFQPQLNLVYSTGSGNGAWGTGWSLGVPGVSRKTSHGIPLYRDGTRNPKEHDIFILSGAEDLVPTHTDQSSTHYRPRTEGLFARILHHHDSQNNYWEVQSKDGLTSLYGTRASASDDAATLADPQNTNKIFAWKLSETTDLFGNRIIYSYRRDRMVNRLGKWDQLYLDQIQYADYHDANGNEQFLVTVLFKYDEQRPDEFFDCRAGFEIRTRLRCSDISIHTAVLPVRSYEFSYQQSPYNDVSLLKTMHITGYDDLGDPHEEMPSLEFGYTAFEPTNRTFFPVTGADMPLGSLGQPDYELADLFGNGLPDVLQMNGTVRVWRNLGGGCFDLPCEMRDAPAGLTLADPAVQMIDADGDGRIDLMALQNGIGGYFPLRYDGQWDRHSLRRYSNVPTFNLEDPEVKLVDLDGDGITDILRSGTSLECYFNDKDPKIAWQRTRRLERQAHAVFPNVNFSDPRVKWGDMNGDGLQDILFVSDGNVEYWSNIGHGSWGSRVSMRNSPRFPYGYDPRRILIGDVDGDGADDLVYVDDRRILVWFNHSGFAWNEEPIEINGTPPVSDMDSVRLVDLLGTGTAGLLWSMDADGQTRDTMYFLDFTGGQKPYLLNSMDNHLGSITQVEYAPSTEFYLADQQQPETRWKTSLPFPVQVVARVEVIDAISGSKLTTQYRYHHGHWDGAEREFRGFGMVEQWDTEQRVVYNSGDQQFLRIQDHFSPPICTRTWFHQGAVGDEYGDWTELDLSSEYWSGDPQALVRPRDMRIALNRLPRRARRDAIRTLQGSVLRTEVYAMDGSELQERPYTVTETLYGVREELPPDSESERSHIFFPHLLAQRTTQWERGDDPMSQVTYTDDYDEYGQPHEQTVVGLPRRAAKRKQVRGAVIQNVQPNETQILTTHTRTVYATPPTGDAPRYLHDRVAHTRTFTMAVEPELSESDPGDLPQVLRDYAEAAGSIHNEFQVLLKDWKHGQALPSDVKLIGHTVNHYDGTAFIGAKAGIVEQYGALTRSEGLVFTEDELLAVYNIPRGTSANFPDSVGYNSKNDSADGYHKGYYVDTQRRQFDFQTVDVPLPRGLVVAMQDALGNRTTITFDDYQLVPIRVTDAANMEMSAVYNYRVMQPKLVTDVNGHTSHFRYTPMGLLHKQFVISRTGEGGTEAAPEAEFDYDFFAYERTRDDSQPQPIFTHSRQRIWHISENVSDDLIESREYSDGFGRVIQKRAQAEDLTFGGAGDDVGLSLQPGAFLGAAVGEHDPSRVVVSGWQVYDNKGRVVEKYEPFFDSGWDYQPNEKRGEHATLYYDPRGQVIRTVNPDGSQQRVIYGIPFDLSLPDGYAPSPWEAYTYDPNDLTDLSGGSLAERAPQTHHYTPTSTILNALGKVICQVERNGSAPATDWFITRSRYDIRGNLLSIWDARGREAFKHAYDLLNRPLRVASIDAGTRLSLLDALGNLIEYRDAKGSFVRREYDVLNRLVRLWARDASGEALTLREVLIYGDAPADLIYTSGVLPAASLVNGNLRGKLYRHYDEAGVVQVSACDFKGNVIESARWVISDAALAMGWKANWQKTNAVADLDTTPYQTRSRYDALNRPIEITYPADVNGQQAVLTPTYNRAGGLERVEVDGQPYVSQIAYNAKGQRVFVAYGNGVMTRYRYDQQTFRLVRLRSERFTVPNADTWERTGVPIQDFTYEYDLVGNIVLIEERTPGCGISAENRNQLRRTFTYDPLYRLIGANGRACRNEARPFDDVLPCGSFHNGTPTPDQNNAPDLTERYIENYTYDPAGNLLGLVYDANTTDWTRTYTYDHAKNNQLTGLTQSGSTINYNYVYDPNGNLTDQGLARRHIWDHADRMVGYVVQAGATPSLEARYLYGADGMRVKKWTRRNGSANTIESTVYISSFFEHDRWNENGTALENNHLHVMDDQNRIAIVRRGVAHDKDAGPTVQYHLSDHLSSSHVVIADNGNWINREEYSPYGETTFGGYARKRYRFTGKERDAESGLNYHGARYYAPWMVRWVSCDPLAAAQLTHSYQYAKQNPVNFVDPQGLSDVKASDTTGTVPETRKEGHIAPYKEHEKRLFKNEGLIKEHTEPGSIYKAEATNPLTGESDFTHKNYREQPTAPNPAEKADAKTNLNSVDPSGETRLSDQAAIREHKENLQSSFDGTGKQMSSFERTEDRIQHAINSGMDPDVARKSAYLQKAHALGTLSLADAGKKVKKFAEALAKNEKVAKAVGHLKVAGKHLAKPILILSFVAGSIGTARAAERGEYVTVVADVVEATPTPLGVTLGFGRGGYSVGEAINVFLSDDTQNAIGGTIQETLDYGWKNVTDFYFRSMK